MSKHKHKGNQGTPEVHSARSKLNGVLQTLVEKKDESPLKEEIKEEVEPMVEAPVTPSKRSKHHSKQTKKKKKYDKEEDEEMGQYHHTYVMKLFDRSVDLAQFDESTPLYPVCRAWMKNQPHNRNLGRRSPTPEPELESSDEEDEDTRPVYRMPSPLTIKTEASFMNNRDLRIPSPLPYPQDEPTLDEINNDLSLQPAPEQLLLNHMVRWKQVRQKWKGASRENEARYGPSLTILKDMYDRACKD